MRLGWGGCSATTPLALTGQPPCLPGPAGFSAGFLPYLASGRLGDLTSFSACVFCSFLYRVCCLQVLWSSKPCRMPASVLAASEGQEGEAPLASGTQNRVCQKNNPSPGLFAAVKLPLPPEG